MDSRDDGLEANTEKTKYMIKSRHQNYSLLIADKYFENGAKFK
jgi:hypothetical protein